MTEDLTLSTQLSTVRGWLETQQPELAKALPQGMDAARFARIALTAVLRNPKLAACSKASFVLSIMEAAALGLEPDSVSGLAYLVPFKGVATLIVGYRGLIQLAYRNPRVIGVGAEAVYEKDGFEYELGLRPKLVHRPAMQTDRGEVTAAYATAQIRGGGRPFVVLLKDEIEAHRLRSRASADGPWVTDYAAMAKKTAVRALAKFLPQSPALMQALAGDMDPEVEAAPGNPPVPIGTTVEGLLDAIAETGEVTP